jgi:hypothetical protein
MNEAFVLPYVRALEAAARALDKHTLSKRHSNQIARTAVSAYLDTLGRTHALVPREATEAMLRAAEDAASDHFAIDGDKGAWLREDGYNAAWQAMIDAAPPAAQDPRP